MRITYILSMVISCLLSMIIQCILNALIAALRQFVLSGKLPQLEAVTSKE